MKVLWLIHYPVYGGPHNRVLRCFPHLSSDGVEVTAVLPDAPGNAADRLRATGVPVAEVPLGRLRVTADPRTNGRYLAGIPGDVRRLRAMIRELGAEAVVVAGLVNLQGPIAARLEGVGVVWQIIDSRIPKPIAAAYMPIVSRLADVAMFGGQTLKQAHPGAEHLRIPACVRPPCVDTEAFHPSSSRRQARRSELGVPDAAPVIGMVANVNPMKGIEYFVQAAAEIYRAKPDAYFLLVGERHSTHGAYEALIERTLVESGIPPERFISAGGTDQPELWYPAMDVKLVTSLPRSEGTTTTSMEALACGVPVVATRVGAVSVVVVDGVTGFTVEPRNPTAIASAVLRLLDDPDLAKRISRAGREIVEAEYSAQAGALGHRRALELAVERSTRRR
jgi:hypothetical protein